MIKRLRKLGRSRALILEKPILELLGLDPSGLVQVILTNGSLVVTPVNPNVVSKEKFQRCLDRVIKTRGDLLKRLGDD
jgi:antitoxin component of MazEF toxin-antitoxin module